MKEKFYEVEAWKWEDKRCMFMDLILEVEEKIGEKLDVSLEFSDEGIKGTIIVENTSTYEEIFPEFPLDLLRYLGATVTCSDPEHPMEFVFKPKEQGKFSVEFDVLTIFKD